MKWIRWCNSGYYLTRSGHGELSHGIAGQLIDCEKVIEWREIESGTLDVESGKLRLVLKPVVPKEPTLLEAASNLINTNLYGMNEVQYAALNELHKAVHREKFNPTKPSKYTDEAVDEFLDAAIERNKNGSQFDLRWFFGDPSILVEEGSVRLYKAFHALLKEREAAK